MNLFYQPSISELAELFSQREKGSADFNIVVDYDGEVLLDEGNVFPQATLDKFKFYIKGIHASLNTGLQSAKKLKLLNAIYKSILFCWEQGVTGPVKPDEITRIQKYKYRIEQHEIRKRAYPEMINYMLQRMY